MMYFMIKHDDRTGYIRTIIKEGPLSWKDMANSLLTVQFDPDIGNHAIIKNRNGASDPHLADWSQI